MKDWWTINPTKSKSSSFEISCPTKFREYLYAYAKRKNMKISELASSDNSYHCCLSRERDAGEVFDPIVAISYESPDLALAMAFLRLADQSCDFLD